MKVCISAPHDWPFEIDRAVVAKAAADLGIKRDIDIFIEREDQLTGDGTLTGALLLITSQVGAQFVPWKSTKRNHIEIAWDVSHSQEEMDIAILHEMDHAAQFEKLGGLAKAQKAYRSAGGRKGYDHNSMEEEAEHKAKAEEAAHHFHLVVPKPSRVAEATMS